MVQIKRLPAAALAVAAFTLYSIATAQSWPARYDGSGSTDVANATCVDHVGNVFVAGKVSTSAQGYNFQVVKYDASGTQQWERHYDGPANSDDVATSVACDWEGNVYVAGVSQGGTGHGESGYDFTVIKYNANGSTVWPNSGSRTGYQFHNGAIRLTDTNDDGKYGNLETFVCSMAMENVAGDEPTFAITGPSNPAGGATGYAAWRTVVFEADASDGVKVKSGWPVDDFGTYEIGRIFAERG